MEITIKLTEDETWLLSGIIRYYRNHPEVRTREKDNPDTILGKLDQKIDREVSKMIPF